MCFQWYQYACSDTEREGLCGRGEKNRRDRGRDRAGEEGGQQTDAQEGESERNRHWCVCVHVCFALSFVQLVAKYCMMLGRVCLAEQWSGQLPRPTARRDTHEHTHTNTLWYLLMRTFTHSHMQNTHTHAHINIHIQIHSTLVCNCARVHTRQHLLQPAKIPTHLHLTHTQTHTITHKHTQTHPNTHKHTGARGGSYHHHIKWDCYCVHAFGKN